LWFEGGSVAEPFELLDESAGVALRLLDPAVRLISGPDLGEHHLGAAPVDAGIVSSSSIVREKGEQSSSIRAEEAAHGWHSRPRRP
jgi:hypothetical protein